MGRGLHLGNCRGTYGQNGADKVRIQGLVGGRVQAGDGEGCVWASSQWKEDLKFINYFESYCIS